ncbi:Ribosomal protein S18 acetylase RimI [Geodermatophilus saharensis]|uniref:Ribosomal protein S18 acetylase RimI n=1 Tax=Geodermatophilus saharensis TaxID=1137994 RepID=A0A239GS02_9ACTN|nr:GNAT family N-acetyltransferase [Geodermatophilus saharensis]SNS71558.1 Ribosomal protein S18 acetylase RimI [Geodermatophilus saharensis]
MPADPVVLRPAVPPDAAAIAGVWSRSFSAALPTVRRAHTDDEVRGWVRDVLVPRHDTWVAEAGGAVVGLLALSDGWLDQLYLDPAWRGRGIGDRFVELAKRRQPAGLQLWTFQVNAPARRFYERHGFRAVEETDGSDNEEREPDVRHVWRPGNPWAGAVRQGASPSSGGRAGRGPWTVGRERRRLAPEDERARGGRR